MPLTTQVKVTLLEGAAKGEVHNYFYKDFTVTERAAADPPNGPPLPPPEDPPEEPQVTEGATESAVSVPEQAAVAASAAVATQKEDICAQFLDVLSG